MDNQNPEETRINIVVKFGKNVYELHHIDTAKSVCSLKQELEPLCQIPPSMQKLMFKGILKDEQIIADTKLRDGSKVMLMGSTIESVQKLSNSAEQSPEVVDDLNQPQEDETPLCQRKEHQNRTKDGPPRDSIAPVPGNTGIPGGSIPGIIGHRGAIVRLTFKSDSLWVASKEQTRKIPYVWVRSVKDYPIEEYDGYRIVVGGTGNSKMYFYFVPRQFIRHIKASIMEFSWS